MRHSSAAAPSCTECGPAPRAAHHTTQAAGVAAAVGEGLAAAPAVAPAAPAGVPSAGHCASLPPCLATRIHMCASAESKRLCACTTSAALRYAGRQVTAFLLLLSKAKQAQAYRFAKIWTTVAKQHLLVMSTCHGRGRKRSGVPNAR